jgi:hypothetical protein
MAKKDKYPVAIAFSICRKEAAKDKKKAHRGS